MRDLLLRKALVAANLLVMLGAGWVAKGASTNVAALLRGPEAVSGGQEVQASPALPASVEPHLDVWRLVGVEPPPSSTAGDADAHTAPARCDDPAEAPARSALPLSLVGAAFGDDPSGFVATVETASGQAQTVAAGDRIAGAEVLGVGRLPVDGDPTGNGYRLVAIVCNQGSREYVELAPARGPSSAPPVRAGQAAVRPLGSERYEIDRAALDRVLSDPGQLTALRAVPVLEGGAVVGFRIWSIQPDSPVAGLGVQNGDVVRLVDGYQLDSVEKALELFQRVREAGRVTLDLERGGRAVRKEVRIVRG